MSELERAKIIERVTRGKQLRLAQGQLLGCGNNIFGYDFTRRTPLAPAKLTINKREAQLVRFIFNAYAKGNCGMNQITRRLEDMGAITKTGKSLWTYSKLKSMLRNPTYTGVKYFNTMRTVREYGNPVTGAVSSRTKVMREKKDWIGIPVPAIISKSLFDKVEERLAWNRKHYRNPRRVQLLSALVRCGQCGSSFFAYQRNYARGPLRNAKKVYHKVAYRCGWKSRQYMHSKHSNVRRCDSKEISAPFLEDQVFALIAAVMFDPKQIRQCMDFFKEKTQGAHLRLEQELKGIEEEIQKCGSKKQRIIDVYASGDLSRDAYVQKSLGYDNTILELKRKRSDILKRIPLLHKTKVIDASIRQYCDTARARYQGCIDFESKRQFVLDYVEKVTFWNDGLAVHGGVPVDVKPQYEDSERIIDAETNKIPFSIESRKITRVSVSECPQDSDFYVR